MICCHGKNPRITVAISGVRPMPPPTSTLKPISPAPLRTRCSPISYPPPPPPPHPPPPPPHPLEPDPPRPVAHQMQADIVPARRSAVIAGAADRDLELARQKSELGVQRAP